MAQPAPQPLDVLDFQFKLQCRLKVFNNESNEEFGRICSLVTTASRYGLVFVGTISKQFQVIRMEDVEDLEKDVSEYPCRVIEIPSKPAHLSVNCDCTMLCVVVERDECSTAIFYDVLSFLREQVTVVKEIRLSATPNVKVVETEWNPALPNIFTACKSDGLLGVYEFKGASLDIKELPPAAKATCFCWSPKGKQLAVGSLDGKITQYKPDLKAVKVVNPPPLEGSPSIISLKWASSFQFIGIYRGSSPDAQSALIVIDAPKTGNPVYTNYEDICYSYGDTRPQQFYMILQQHWNVLMVASSNSMEVGVLANESDKWMQWILGDISRAELPLSISKQETMPIGMTLNTGTSRALGSGEKSPMLLLMSHYGQLCCFYAINSKPGALSACSPPENVAYKSENLFKKQTGKQEPAVSSPVPKSLLPTPAPPPTPIATTPTVTQASFFGGGGTHQPPFLSTPTTPKPLATNLFGTPPQTTSSSQLATSMFGANNTKPVQQPAKPVPQPALIIKAPITIASPATPEADTNKTQTPSKRGQDGRFIVNKETEVMIAKLIHEESLTFEAEFKALLHSCRDISVNIGSDNEATQMVQQCNSLQEFLKALKETLSGQTAEIHTLKQTVIQTWAWYEEARSRFSTSQDPILLKVLQGRPLDPASQQQLEDINHSTYYLDSQLLQANKHLDEQWEAFQDTLLKNKKVQVPTMEAIYQSMVKQNATLQKQRYLLKDISSRIQTHRRHQTGNILISLDKVDDLQEELEKLKLYPDECAPQVHYKRVLDRQRKLTKEKSEKLFNFFSKRDVTHVSVSKPQLNNSTVHLTTLLAAPLSPIEKKTNKPDFVMSTPKLQEKVPLFKDPPKNMTVIFDKNKGICPTSTPLVKPKESVDKGILKSQDAAASKSSAGVTFNLNPAGQMFGAPHTKVSATMKYAPTNKGLVFASTNANVSAPTTVVSKSTFSFTSVSATSGAEDNKVTSLFSKPASLFPQIVPGLTIGPVSTNQAPANNLMGSAFTSTPASKAAGTEAKFSGKVAMSATPVFATATSSPFVKTTPSPLPDSSTSTPAKLTITALTTKSPAMSPDSSKPSAVATTSTAGLNTTMSTPDVTVSPFATSAGPGFGQKSVFGTKSSTSSSPQGLIFGTSTTVGTVFSSAPTAVASTPSTTGVSIVASTPSIFGGAAKSIVSTPITVPASAGIFGNQTVSITITKVVTTGSTVLSTSGTGTTSTGIFSPPSSTTSVTGIFGGGSSTAVSSSTSVSSSGIFGSATPSTTGIFGTPAAPTTTASGTSIFGAGSNAGPTTTVSETNIFVAPTTTASGTGIFGGGPTAASGTSIFGGGSTAAPTTTASGTGIFGSETTAAPTTTASGTSIFGGGSTAAPTTTTTTTQSSIFGGVTSAPFGAAAPLAAFGSTPATTTFAATPAKTTFGATPAAFGPAQLVTATTTQTLFGLQPSGTTTSAFGSPFTTQTTSAFGATPPFGAVKASPFGGFGAGAAASGPLFGQPAAFGNGASGGSIFGGGASTTASGVFGGGASTTTSSGFGGAADTTNSNVFGGGATTTASSVFGGTTNTFGSNSNPSVFGSAPTAASPFRGGSVFGTATNTNSPFGAAASSSAPSPFAQTGSAFGSTPAFGGGGFGATTGGAFGFNNLNVGSTTTTTSSGGFGTFSQQNAQNPFGRGTPQEAKSPFSGGSVFGAPATTTAASVFGGSSPFSKPTAPAFGSPPSFGQPGGFSQTAFGQTSTFGSPGFGNSSQGAFSAGGQSIQQTGFGSPAFQKPAAAFGSGPVFGSTSPGFGSAPSFGGVPTFGGGGGGTFGSPQKVFGAAPTTESTFGAVAQNPTFGNLANQNTLGFGNLAQQAAAPPAPQPTSFSGGSSFSSWR